MALILSGDTGVPASGMPTGSVIQTVSTTYATEVTSSSTTRIDTGLTATITPISTTSKILVTAHINGVLKVNEVYILAYLYRGTTELAKIEDGALYTNDSSFNAIGSVSISYLDSPSTTSATVYKVMFRSAGAALVRVQVNSSTSTMTLLEIKQ